MSKLLLYWNAFYQKCHYRGKNPEEKLHIQIVMWLRTNHPELLFWHTPSEAKRHPLTQMRNKLMGVLPGVPDIFIPEPKVFREICGIGKYEGVSATLHNGFFCELKAEYVTTVKRKAGPKTILKKNTESDSQKDVRKQLEALGYYCCVCYSLDEFKKEWEGYCGEN